MPAVTYKSTSLPKIALQIPFFIRINSATPTIILEHIRPTMIADKSFPTAADDFETTVWPSLCTQAHRLAVFPRSCFLPPIEIAKDETIKDDNEDSMSETENLTSTEDEDPSKPQLVYLLNPKAKYEGETFASMKVGLAETWRKLPDWFPATTEFFRANWATPFILPTWSSARSRSLNGFDAFRLVFQYKDFDGQVVRKRSHVERDKRGTSEEELLEMRKKREEEERLKRIEQEKRDQKVLALEKHVEGLAKTLAATQEQVRELKVNGDDRREGHSMVDAEMGVGDMVAKMRMMSDTEDREGEEAFDESLGSEVGSVVSVTPEPLGPGPEHAEGSEPEFEHSESVKVEADEE
ncbi:MAG: hypothetical protein M1820_007118 [Bogoriella megaspora]|nr:MAG: hypothetical protein M1820_007118 [Bogoriella megaspora]